METKLLELQKELQNVITEMNNIKTQISQLNQKGEQLATRGNYIKGKIDAFQELVNEEKVNDDEKNIANYSY